MKEASNLELSTKETQQKFLAAILKPDLTEALTICHNFIVSQSDISIFWEDIIKPSLYEVGLKWERGEIVHQQEHLATSICSRVINEYDPLASSIANTQRRILITCSTFEKHTVGIRMLHQLLKINGINSTLKLCTPVDAQDICTELEYERYDAVLFSTTMYENIIHTEHLIKNVRENTGLENIPFLISGGQAFKNIQVNTAKVVQRMFGHSHADLYMFTAAELITFLTEERASR